VLLAPDGPRAEAASEALRRRLAAAGFAQHAVAPAPAALEDVFVALLRGEALVEPGPALPDAPPSPTVPRRSAGQ
jgi:hypothetical protein